MIILDDEPTDFEDSWVLTDSGELCEAACSRNGLSCFETPSTDMLSQLNSKAALHTLLTETGIAGGSDSYCKWDALMGGEKGFAMAEKGGGQTCYYIGGSEAYRTDICTYTGWQENDDRNQKNNKSKKNQKKSGGKQKKGNNQNIKQNKSSNKQSNGSQSQAPPMDLD